MIVVLITGLWAVLAIGRHVSAPEDLAGKWQLQSNIRGIPNDELTVEQSGRFFQVEFGRGTKLNLRWDDQSGSTIRLADGNTKMTLSGAPDSDDKTVELSGSAAGRWLGHRVSRTFPVDRTKEAH